MNKFLSFTRSLLKLGKPKPPTIDSYGQTSSGVDPGQIQSVMEWLFLSLLSAGYQGKSHIIWYNDSEPNPSLESAVKEGIQRGEPTFLYRCGNRVQPPPEGYYWRMISEHPSTRIYQLEVRDDD